MKKFKNLISKIIITKDFDKFQKSSLIKYYNTIETRNKPTNRKKQGS